MRKPTPALVISIIALFVALGGVGWTATGGNFILGNANTASSTSSLSAPINGDALRISNTNTSSLATGLRLTVAPGHAPIRVSSGAGKAPNLNADLLDGLDYTRFARGKSAQIVSARVATPNDSTCCPWHPVLTVPNFGTLKGQCPTFLGSYMYFFHTDTSGWQVIEKHDGTNPVVVTSLGSNLVQDAAPGGDHFTLALGHGAGTSAVTATVDVYTYWDSTGGCIWQAEAVESQGS